VNRRRAPLLGKHVVPRYRHASAIVREIAVRAEDSRPEGRRASADNLARDFQAARALHRRGEFFEAARLYGQILQSDRGHFEAW
jgi:hypothetical protein